MGKPEIYEGKQGLFSYYFKYYIIDIIVFLILFVVIAFSDNIWQVLAIWTPIMIIIKGRSIIKEARKRTKYDKNRPFQDIVFGVIEEYMKAYVFLLIFGLMIAAFVLSLSN